MKHAKKTCAGLMYNQASTAKEALIVNKWGSFVAVKIFLCYARKDERMLRRLKEHLKALQRNGLIDTWYDRDITAGAEWEQAINKHLNEAQIILLLVSSAFMDSDYCYSIEMKQAIERHERGEAHVIPIILRPVHWRIVPINKLHALPKDAKPISTWKPQDCGFTNVTEGIYDVIRRWYSQYLPNLTADREEASVIGEQQFPLSSSPFQKEQTSISLVQVQEETLYELLPLCTVKITATGAGRHGTGFFIAPNQILTSLEVIRSIINLSDPNRPQNLIVHWNTQVYAARLIQLTATFVEFNLALVELHVSGHPCVSLQGDTRPSDFLYSYGYPDDYIEGASATFEYEGRIRIQRELLKFKSGQVQPGMSGSPLLNLRTGKVCGIILRAHGANLEGGIAIPAEAIFQCLPELRAVHQRYHLNNIRWIECLNRTQLR